MQGPAKSKLDVLILRGDVLPGATYTIHIPAKYNTIIYILNGSLTINENEHIAGLHLIQFNNDADNIHFSTNQKTQFLVLGGLPLNEPIESYGPFVMTSQTEIMQALRDYQMGKMGVLIEEW